MEIIAIIGVLILAIVADRSERRSLHRIEEDMDKTMGRED